MQMIKNSRVEQRHFEDEMRVAQLRFWLATVATRR